MSPDSPGFYLTYSSRQSGNMFRNQLGRVKLAFCGVFNFVYPKLSQAPLNTHGMVTSIVCDVLPSLIACSTLSVV